MLRAGISAQRQAGCFQDRGRSVVTHCASAQQVAAARRPRQSRELTMDVAVNAVEPCHHDVRSGTRLGVAPGLEFTGSAVLPARYRLPSLMIRSNRAILCCASRTRRALHVLAAQGRRSA